MYPTTTVMKWYVENSNACLILGDVVPCEKTTSKIRISCDECLFNIFPRTKDILLEYLLKNKYVTEGDILQATLDGDIDYE